MAKKKHRYEKTRIIKTIRSKKKKNSVKTKAVLPKAIMSRKRGDRGMDEAVDCRVVKRVRRNRRLTTDKLICVWEGGLD